MQKSAFFLQEYLLMSKKSSNFALAFEKQVSFDFLPETRTLKLRFSNEDLIFLRQTERKLLWKIDTISVVQEQKIYPPSLADVSSLRFLHLINSIILSYLIISFYNEEFDPGSGWTLATGLTHASRGAAGLKLALIAGDRRTGA